MALLQTSLIWVTGLVALAILIIVSITFVAIYSSPRDRSLFVSVVTVLSLTSLLATVCLLPLDIALIASTTDNATGTKKKWADPDTINNILLSLKVVYYLLYSLDAILCIIVIPFAYFWYEEWDIDSTAGSRIRGALKYTMAFVCLLLVLFLVGFFVPVAAQRSEKEHYDLDFFRKLLLENRGERALTFIVGVLLCLGTVIYAVYTGPGLALFPVSLIKSIPAISITSAEEARDALAINRERQRIIEAKLAGGNNLSPKERREFENLQREERSLTRKQRLADEGKNTWWLKVQAALRPFKLFLGLLLLAISTLLVTSMLITGIDKIKFSKCGAKCGYILTDVNIFNPINWIILRASKVFPIDYIIIILLVLFFFVSTVIGLAFIGIRFLWIVIFKIRAGHTKPQALLMGTTLLTLSVLAINYGLTMFVAPQYSHFGGQKYCTWPMNEPGVVRDCTNHPDHLIPCSASATGPAAEVCTPTVVSTFINRITLNYPFFGVFTFWAQFAFIGLYLITALTALVRTPKMNFEDQLADEDEEEEESLLGATGTRFRGAWDDVQGGRNGNGNYGSS
ncbi:hypothetical protein H072_5134 [Dactylellina haptotyla CBS 200.50]|uniref:Probable lysosomal cobalamin transporter n=1 Tax=Dactylellina haptotyla (strain CBS 200.50) TaxID=1284197 RepID=S8ADD6_DACHA|nr:hypothetical protein H072_5134 [Dactylellina haptotyla CBS 200.50]